MSDPAASFEWSDAWVLLVVVVGGGQAGADLRGIIAAADYINHAIPTYAELDGGLMRLKSIGFVEEHGSTYRVSDDIWARYVVTTKPGRSIWQDFDEMEALLSHSPAVRLVSGAVISHAMYEEAVQTYLNQHRVKEMRT
jgi:hypothetical protein